MTQTYFFELRRQAEFAETREEAQEILAKLEYMANLEAQITADEKVCAF